MKKVIYFYAALLIILSVTISCVSKKKYKASQTRISAMKYDSIQARNMLDMCNVSVKNLQTDKATLENDYNNSQKDLKNLSTTSKMTIADQARRLKNLQDLIQSQRDVMNKLKASIAAALINFKADELSVYIKDGNVYVSLEEKLLFKSGSAEVDPKGKQALAKVAEVLNSTPDINVVIEGHTDNVPIKGGKFEDNWALSSGRATNIVRILTKDYGFDPHRITAAGRGEFHPVKTNETTEGKAGNRRTEIILSPNLTELYKLLEQ